MAVCNQRDCAVSQFGGNLLPATPYYLLECSSLQLANENSGSKETVAHGDCQVSTGMFAQSI